MEYSECCDAVLINGICQDCNEHSEAIKYDCDICKDTGIVSKTEWHEDENSEFSYDVDKKCICQDDD